MLRRSVLNVSELGLFNNISFDSDGIINSNAFTILQSSNSDWITIGEWSPNNITINDDLTSNLTMSPDVKFHLNVVAIIEPPFVYLEKNNGNKSEATELKGFCIDLMKKLSEKIGFSYKLHLVRDGQFGSYHAENQSWNGVIGELERGEAEFAVGPITATVQRSNAVNFLPSFLDVGLKFILNVTAIENESSKSYSPFAFLFPFNRSLYAGILISVMLMAGFLCLLSKLSPFGIRGTFFLSTKVDQLEGHQQTRLSHRNKRQIQEDKKDAERGMGLNNALYFVWAALFWQTPERVPRSISARVITVAWYLAAVVFLASYTANMVAVISNHNDKKPIDSLNELMLQNRVTYGTVLNSAVETSLAQSEILLAKKLYKLLWENPREHFVPTFEVGLELVHQGNYSLLWDSISLDYAVTNSHCLLQTTDVGFGMVKYAFATTKNSSHFNILSSHLDRLKQQGFVTKLYGKYFSKLYECENKKKRKSKVPHQLTFSDLAGIFYLVGISMVAGLVVLLGEWLMVAISDVNKCDPKAPQTIKQAVRIRRNRVIEDFWRNWFPIESVNEKWSHLSLPTQPLAEKLIQRRLSQKLVISSFSSQLHVSASRSEEKIKTK